MYLHCWFVWRNESIWESNITSHWAKTAAVNAHSTVLDSSMRACLLNTKCVLMLKAFHLNQAALERTLSHWAVCWDWIAKAQNSFFSSFDNAAEISFPLTLRPSGFFQHVGLNFQTDLSSADLRRFVYLTPNS